MAVTRTFYATIEIACCRDNTRIYNPLPRKIKAPQTKDFFDDSLTIWRDKAETAIYDKYYKIAEDECEGMGATPKLCFFEMSNIRVEEEGVPIPPVTITDYIRTVEGYIDDSKDNIREMEDEIADILVIPSNERTSAQKDEIRRLDEEIRKENEFLREYEGENRRLKAEYGVD